MDKLECMQVFIEVAKHRSFVATAEHLNLSAPAVTRAIASLETRLGAKLFNRTTRHVMLTESGVHYLTNAKRILEDIDEAESVVAGINAMPKGTLTVTAPVLFGEKHVIPIITEYMDEYPQVSVRAIFSDRVSNMLEEELDVAVRIGHLQDSNLYATDVGSVRRMICASPRYLQKYGRPKTPSDLNDHRSIFLTSTESSTVWHFIQNGKKETIKLTPRLHCSQSGSAIRAAIEGYGLARQMSYQIGEELKKGTLEAVLTEFEEPPLPVSLVRLEGRLASGKIRSFLDFAAVRLKANPFINNLATVTNASYVPAR